MHIEIKKFETNYNRIDDEAVKVCFDLIKNNLDNFHELQFIASEHNSNSITDVGNEKFNAQLNDRVADPIFKVFHQLIDSLPKDEVISTTELRLQNVDQKYISMFIGYFHAKILRRTSEMTSNITMFQKPKFDSLKCLPLRSPSLESLYIAHCYLDAEHFRQLNNFYTMCYNLKHLDLTNVITSNSWKSEEIKKHFVDSMEFMANSLGKQIETLIIPNNDLKDETFI